MVGENRRDKYIDLRNPINLIVTCWLVALLYSAFIDSGKSVFSNISIGIYLVYIGFTGLGIYTLKSSHNAYVYEKSNISRFLRRVCIILLLYQLIKETLYVGGIPLFSAIGIGLPVNYNDAQNSFGLTHTLFVKQNILFLYISHMIEIKGIKSKLKSKLRGFFLWIIPILLLARSILVLMLLLSLLNYFFWNRLRWKHILILVILLLPVSYGFDRFVDIRNMTDTYYIENYLQEKSFLQRCSDGALSILNYAVNPTQNLLENISQGNFSIVPKDPSHYLRGFVGNSVFQWLKIETVDMEEIVFLRPGQTIAALAGLLYSFGYILTLGPLTLFALISRVIYTRAILRPEIGLPALLVLQLLALLSLFSLSLSDSTFFVLFGLTYVFPPLKSTSSTKVLKSAGP